MRLAILNITSGGMSQGYEKYLQNIIPRFASHPEISGLLVGMPKTMDILAWEKEFPGARWVSLNTPIFPWQGIGKAAEREVDKFCPDLIFIPTAHLRKIKQIPVVNMVQNMWPFFNLGKGYGLKEKLRHRALYFYYKRAVRKSDRIIAASNFVRDYLMNNCDVPAEKIRLIYYGINLPENDSCLRPTAIPEEWEEKFLFTAGSVYPARGLEDAISSLKKLTTAANEEKINGLVIAGEASRANLKYAQKLKSLVHSEGLSSNIVFTGELNRSQMNWCYKNCSAFLMTSRIESVSMVALEVMAWGCICISTDNPPMPEIFKDTAVYYSPGDIAGLTNTIKTVLSWDTLRRNEASLKAKKRAADFSWDICVEKTISVFQDLLK